MKQNVSLGENIRLAPGSWGKGRSLFLAMAVGGLGLSLLGFLVDRDQFFHSYLTAYIFVLTTSLGCLFFVMLQHLTRAGWSVAVRRVAEVAASTMPFLALLFLPVLLGLRELFHWSHAEAVATDPLLQHKQGYLNAPFFIVRAVLYFAVWSLLGRYFFGRSVAQDKSKEPKTTVAMQRRAAPGILLFALTLTFMAFDWLMSLDPHWFSTIFGVYNFAGTVIAGVGFLAVTLWGLRKSGYLADVVRVDHYQDLGRILFSFSVFWTYIGFSQFFLIWYGNIPEETGWFLDRARGNWRYFSGFLAVGHFIVPLVLLMSRFLKRIPGFVVFMGAWMLLMQYTDITWMVMPNLHENGPSPSWQDLAALAFISGVYLSVFSRRLAAQALVPVGDPRLAESLALRHAY